ncbi:MAG: hypothetical protein ACRCTA_02400, partial [Bacilli bacterium]
MYRKKLKFLSIMLLALYVFSFAVKININANTESLNENVEVSDVIDENNNTPENDEQGFDTNVTEPVILESKNDLNAQDFSLTLSNAKDLSSKDAVSLGKVSTNLDISSVVVDEVQLKAIQNAKEAGTYPLTFSLENLSKQVNVTVSKAKVEGKLEKASTDITIEIPGYNETFGWYPGGIKDVIINVDFKDSTSAGKQIEIILPEGMSFASIPSTTQSTGIFIPTSGVLTSVISGEVLPVENALYKSYNGKLTYKFISNVSKVELTGFQIAVDKGLYYGPKSFDKAITVNSFVNDTIVATNYYSIIAKHNS